MASLLSREKGLGQVLDFNFGGGERKGDVFGEILDLAARRSLRCFCVVVEIL